MGLESGTWNKSQQVEQTLQKTVIKKFHLIIFLIYFSAQEMHRFCNFIQYWDIPSPVSFSCCYFFTFHPDISVFEASYSDNLIYQKTPPSFLRQYMMPSEGKRNYYFYIFILKTEITCLIIIDTGFFSPWKIIDVSGWRFLSFHHTRMLIA